jgi:hypothetical protein
MSLKQQIIYDNLVKTAEENGCQVVSLVYEFSNSKMEFRCPKGHIRITSARQFKKIPRGCKICNGGCPIEAENRFVINIEKLGGKVIGYYNGNNTKVECLCSNNHTCYPVPAKIQSGRGMCRKCKGNCPIEAEKNFVDNVNKLGGKIIGKYTGKDNSVECECINGHPCFPQPGNLRNGQGMCVKCSTIKWSNKAEHNFIFSIEKLGGKVIGQYEDTDTKVKCECPNGHICFPCPSGIRDGRGMCIKCAGHCPEESEKNFIENIGKLGGRIIGKYERSDTKVECLCFNNHICFPTPNSVQQGGGMCIKCAGQCPEEAEKNFIKNIKKLGGKVIGKYERSDLGVECLCSNNHICFPRPSNIKHGAGMCIKCSGGCPEEAEKNFVLSIKNLGGKVVGKYEGTAIKVECICSNNHICFPIPHGIKSGEGMCKKCAGNCPEEAKKNFITNVEKLGGKITGEYVNSTVRVECICISNHICYPLPSSVQQGGGMCKTCVLEQTESKGELLTSKALDKLGITYTKQYKHPRLPRLRFDFQFEYENKLFLVEFDGSQHQKENKHFHRIPGDFDKQRQRDLMKNYLVKNVPDCVLIRLDHEWLKMDDPVESISEYIWEKMGEPSGTVVAENLLYMWIFDEPTEESINKYFIL